MPDLMQHFGAWHPGPHFHGTSAELEPGDLIEPGKYPPSHDPEGGGPGEGKPREHTYFSPRKSYVTEHYGPNVYEVEPAGEFTHDSEYDNRTMYKSRHPLRVVRKVTKEWGLPHEALLEHFASQADWTFYHGTPDVRHWQHGAVNGIHVGTEEAAHQALNARIGKPLEGKWDGTREYGKTLLSPYQSTGTERDLENARYPSGKAGYTPDASGHSTPVPMDARPHVFPVRIKGPMIGHPAAPVTDDYANARMRGQLTRGNARRGYFYRNVGEDEGSISAAVPSAAHLERLDVPKTAGLLEHFGAWYHGTNHQLHPGQVLTPEGAGDDHVFFSGNKEHADFLAAVRADPSWTPDQPEHSAPRTYEVEPLDHYEADPEDEQHYTDAQAYRTRGRVRVIRQAVAGDPAASGAFPNPYHGTVPGGRPEFGHTWFHGTKQSGPQLSEGRPPVTRWSEHESWPQPNKLLGTHFSPLHSVAHGFAFPMHGSSWSTPPTPGEPSALVHAKLHFKNPAHFPSEDHLNLAIAKWADRESPHWHDATVNKFLAGSYQDQEGTHKDWHQEPRDLKHHHYLANQAQSVMSWHPKLPEILKGFTDHLHASGHYGITYGNQVEGPFGSVSAIATHPSQIETTHVEHIAAPDRDPHPHEVRYSREGDVNHTPGGEGAGDGQAASSDLNEPDEFHQHIEKMHTGRHKGGYETYPRKVDLAPGYREHHEAAARTAPAVPPPEVREYEGTTGDPSHITRSERGMIPVAAVAHLEGVSGEQPGEHRNHRGPDWESFKAAFAAGEMAPIFVTVDHGQEPKISEGNHRRDAAVELGHEHIPAEVRYFGHAEHQGTVTARAGLGKTAVHPGGDLSGMSAKQDAPVEWVRTDKLMKHREWIHGPGFSRSPEGQEMAPRHTPEEWAANVKSVKDEGIRQPLHMSWDPKSNYAYVTEGNSRLAWAHEAGHEAVPVTGHKNSWIPDRRKYKLPGKSRGPELTNDYGHINSALAPSSFLPDDYMHHPGQHTTASIAMPSEYGDDNTAPPEGEIHRGVALHGLAKYHPEVHQAIHDESAPVHERAARLMEHMGPRLEKDKWGGGGVGKHWSTSERTARGFATSYEHSAEHPWHEFHQDPSVTRVVFHAAPPKQSHMITSPRTKMEHDILPTTHGEREVPLRNRAPVHLTGVSWSRNEKDAPWTRHDFPGPVRVKASAAEHEALYHSGGKEFPGDEEWVHLGTREAAVNRARDWHEERARRGAPAAQAYMHTVRLAGNHSPATETDDVVNQPGIGSHFLKNGHTVVPYINEYEDPGTVSYLAHRSAVSLLKTEPLSARTASAAPFLHGGPNRVEPGGVIHQDAMPASHGRLPHNYFTTSRQVAEDAADMRNGRGHGWIHTVEPTGPYERDNGEDQSWRSEAPLRVLSVEPGKYNGSTPHPGITRDGSSDGDRYFTCAQGHEHWGAHGAAGLLIRHKGEDGQHRYLLQKRSPYVDHGSTWSVPGGAIGKNETPEKGAWREAREELGAIPQHVTHHHTVVSTDCGNWKYHTVVADAGEHFMPRGGGTTQHETEGVAWHTADEIDDLDKGGDLHPGFAKSWDKVRRSRGPKTAAAEKYYHGTADEYSPGDQIEHHYWKKYPDRADFRANTPLYATTNPALAGHMADLRGGHGKGHLYEVRPTGPLKPDEIANPVIKGAASWQAHDPLHVVREIPRHEWPEDLNSWQVPRTAAATRTKDQVNYRPADGPRTCGTCSMIRMNPPDFESYSCTLVKGLIKEEDTCDEWSPAGKTAAARSRQYVRRMHPKDLLPYARLEAYRTDDEGGMRHRQDLARKITEKGYRPALHGGMSGDKHSSPVSSPITLVHEDGQSYLEEGHHRTMALDDAGYDKPVPVLVKDFRTKTAARDRSVPIYHGNRYPLNPGDLIHPGRQSNYPDLTWDRRSTHVYATDDLAEATGFAEQAKTPHRGHVYQVEPTGRMLPDKEKVSGEEEDDPAGNSWMSRHPLRVVREVHHSQLPAGYDLSAIPRHTWDSDETLREPYGDWASHQLKKQSVITPGSLPARQQSAFDVEDLRDHRRQMLDVAKDPDPGTRVWRGEMRDENEHPRDATSVGMHWTVNPDSVIANHSGEPGKRRVVFQGIVENHAEQAFPRSHPMWRGKHESYGHEAEVRFKPGARVKLEGAYVDHSGNPGYLVPQKPERTSPGWEYHKLDHHVTINHRGHGAADYSELGIPREAAWFGEFLTAVPAMVL